MLLAEHARWAQREALKALHLATEDASRAAEAAGRANTATLKALRQPGASFPVYAERPLPGEPYEIEVEEHRRPSGWFQGHVQEVDLPQLARWFAAHPGPPPPPPAPRAAAAPRGGAASPPALPGTAPGPLAAPSATRKVELDAGAAPVPFLEGRGTYPSGPPAVVPASPSAAVEGASAPAKPARPRLRLPAVPSLPSVALPSAGILAPVQREVPAAGCLLLELAAAGLPRTRRGKLAAFLARPPRPAGRCRGEPRLCCARAEALGDARRHTARERLRSGGERDWSAYW